MNPILEFVLGAVVELFLFLFAAGLIYRLWSGVYPIPRHEIVGSFQKGVLLRGSEVEKVLDPGSYWIGLRKNLVRCDMRPAPFELTGQELLTADSRLVKVSIGGEYRVANPALFVAESSDASSTFDLEVRQALRNAVGELTSSNFLTEHAVLPLRIKELLVPRATQLGIDLMQIQIYEAAPRGWLDEA